ncbi:hypothetical protein [Treponema ruminis]|uniref:Amino acid transporter n=1 Tax=Treponema ruminis TaxID=744515 RepID=A0A7W8G8K1_9SPIR|nr:hypothetical protein [Treponema ruminis]MBB5225840.1 amino acid transporter [Treponema ruminis]
MFVFLIFACALLSSLLIFPLYFCATTFSTFYSFTVTFLIAAFLIFIFIKQIKKHGAKAAVFFLVKFLILAAGLSFSFIFVTKGSRLPALLILLAATALFILASKILKSKSTELSSENL